MPGAWQFAVCLGLWRLDQKALVVHLQDLHPRLRLSAVGDTLNGRLGKSSTGGISVPSH